MGGALGRIECADRAGEPGRLDPDRGERSVPRNDQLQVRGTVARPLLAQLSLARGQSGALAPLRGETFALCLVDQVGEARARARTPQPAPRGRRRSRRRRPRDSAPGPAPGGGRAVPGVLPPGAAPRAAEGIPSRPCKTSGSHRTLSLDGAGSIEALREHRERQKVERALAGDASAGADLIFADELGGLLSPQATTRRFEALRKAAKIRDGRLHDLRHSHATHLLTSGVPVGTVSARLGHSSPVVTLTVYGHVIPNSDKAGVEALAAALVG